MYLAQILIVLLQITYTYEQEGKLHNAPKVVKRYYVLRKLSVLHSDAARLKSGIVE